MNTEEALRKRRQEQAKAEAISDLGKTDEIDLKRAIKDPGYQSAWMMKYLAQQQENEARAELENKMFEANREFHARQQYADFVKAAMQAILTDPIWVNNIEGLAVSACDAAEATLEEMTRRGK